MGYERTREKIVHLVNEMHKHTVDRGCSPDEAASFAAKAAEWIEKYQIGEAELRNEGSTAQVDIEVCQNTLRTGKKVFNPGMTQVVNGLATAMCCKCVMLHESGEAVYGIVGSTLDADYVCQIATVVVPALQVMAMLEGREHGYEKAGLVRWSNQYLTGAATEIRKRIESDRKERSDVKEAEHQLTSNGKHCTALVVTGESIAVTKREATKEAFSKLYPRTRTTFSRSAYDHTANERGREAGKRVGLNIPLE